MPPNNPFTAILLSNASSAEIASNNEETTIQKRLTIASAVTFCSDSMTARIRLKPAPGLLFRNKSTKPN